MKYNERGVLSGSTINSTGIFKFKIDSTTSLSRNNGSIYSENSSPSLILVRGLFTSIGFWKVMLI